MTELLTASTADVKLTAANFGVYANEAYLRGDARLRKRINKAFKYRRGGEAMKKYWIGLVVGFFLGATGLAFVWSTSTTTEATSVKAPESGPKRILVPFMHMRGFGGGAGHESKSGEATLGAGTEIEIWNIDDKEPLTVTEIYFTAPDGKTVLEGSKYGLPLPLELKPKTHYHFSSFYEHFKLPVPTLPEGRKNFIHGYLADVRWKGPAPRVRGWDKGVKNGDYILVTPVTVFEE